ncbi:two-component system response regulator [Massilia sp. IC2-476]|uniref:response regulator n=1 Tax=Massilia sp. IC2-476 TaxID=2887199 RepID=UPI001D1079E0|nr:response regulator [Massilia sp. IC2-476]MCC2973183.1 response regulator [Massilia sp. IC2-476]
MQTRYPFTVRLVGFAPPECAQLESLLAQAPLPGASYFCLHDDSLQEPDLYIADGSNPAALARLACLPPGALQPILMIGGDGASKYRTLPRPVDSARLYQVLAELLDTRVKALVALAASGERSLPERRRRPRLAPDTEAPAYYQRLRQGPPDGAVLIIDKGGAFRDHVARVVSNTFANTAGPASRSIEWTDSGRAAVRLCDETPVSLVMINTCATGIEPYSLSSAIKSQEGAGRTAVLFLVGQSFKYDSLRARDAGVRGLLDKPVADRHLLATFQKLLALPH